MSNQAETEARSHYFAERPALDVSVDVEAWDIVTPMSTEALAHQRAWGITDEPPF